jgi:anthranilate phosphoribosyltransferase
VIAALGRLARGHDLTEDEAAETMALIMRDEATPVQIAGFMMGLRVKGETIDEVTGLCRTARELAVRVEVEPGALDVVGTGGDMVGTFNISTLAALVVAGCGVRVAKHGNRAQSSRCGAADVLEALGVRIELPPEAVATCVDRAGIGFMLAPRYHPAFRFVGVPRRELGVRTVFNIIGPLCNPARVTRQVTGVAEPNLVDLVAQVLPRLGVDRCMVFHGAGGMDELSIAGPSRVVEVLDGVRRDYALEPAELGLPTAPVDTIKGGDAEHNAAIATDLLSGATGPRRDVLLLNAAAGLRVAGAVEGWREGIALAAESIDQGRAAAVLESWARLSQEVAP